MITVDRLTKAYGDFRAVDDVSFVCQAGTGDRLPRTQRRRQDHDHARHGRPHRSDQRAGHHRWLRVRRHPQPLAPRRSAARRLRAARRPDRSRDPLARGAGDGAAVVPRRRDARARRADRDRGEAADAQLLARHEAAARTRARAAGRSRGADPRRACQRPRPRRHPVDARAAEVLRRPRRHRAALEPPAQRGRADRRRDDPHRPRPDRRPGRQEVAPRRGARSGHVAGDVARQHGPRNRARPARPPRRPDGRRTEGDRLDRGGRARRARGRDRADRPPHRGRGPGGPVPRAHLGHGTGRCGRRTSAATAVPRRARAEHRFDAARRLAPHASRRTDDEHRHRRSHPLDISATPPIPFWRLVLVELRKAYDTRAGFWLLFTIGLLITLLQVVSLVAFLLQDYT